MSGTSGKTFDLPLAQIRPSPSNPRKRFDEAALAELAESIKAKGVLQPILVRPTYRLVRNGHMTALVAGPETFWGAGPLGEGPSGPPGWPNMEYQLVAGERRWRAAKLAGLDVIPAVVRDLSDRDALEIAVIENDQREDTTPLERADGYAALVEKHGVTVEDLAQRVGKSTSTIRDLLKLRVLPKDARQALEDGKLSASVASLIARVPGEKARKEVAKTALGNHWGEGGVSYRGLKRVIEDQYMVELKSAKFPRKALDLVPDAGSCDACPKRTGNARDLYPDARADVCTDPDCYRAKCAAHAKNVEAAAKAEGKKVLSGKEAAKLFEQHSYAFDRLPYNSPFIDLDTPCYDVPGRGGNWRKIIGKQKLQDLAGEIVLAFSQTNTLHHLLPKAIANKAVGKSSGNTSTSAADARWKREQREAERKAKAGKAAARKANGIVAQRVTELALAVREWPPALTSAMRVLGQQLAEIVWSDACRQVAKRRELQGDYRVAVAQAAGMSLRAADALGLIAELIAARKSLDWGGYYSSGCRDDAKDKEFWQLFGIKRADLVKEALKPAAAKPSANGKHKAKAKKVRKCRVCGCTDNDCRQCIEKTGQPCHWVEADLCSACEDEAAQEAAIQEEMEQAGGNGDPGWRDCPLEDLEIGNSLTEDLLKRANVFTCGDLGDALASPLDVHLELCKKLGPRLCKKLMEMIELASADDLPESEPLIAGKGERL